MAGKIEVILFVMVRLRFLPWKGCKVCGYGFEQPADKAQQTDDMVTDGKLRNKSVGIDKEAKVEV